ncbi:MAG TPA: ABC transporter ATP-binding protein [Mycobacteriales bacterium]|nr:ABC transporter ATP-binding protein [Mycobacteriales bacterium]
MTPAEQSLPPWHRGLFLWLTTGFRAAPGLTVIAGILAVLQGISIPAQAYSVKLAIDGVTEHQSTKLVAAAVIMTIVPVVRGIGSLVIDETVIERVHGYLHADLIRIATGIPQVEHQDRPEVGSRIHLLHDNSTQMSFNTAQLLQIGVMAINVATMLVILGQLSPWLLLVTAGAAIRLASAYLDARLRWRAVDESAGSSRRAYSLARISTSVRHAVEIRAFDLRHVLTARVDRELSRVQDERTRAAWRGGWVDIVARLLFAAVYAGAILFVVDGDFSAGQVALVIILGSQIEQTSGGLALVMRQITDTIGMFTRYAWLRRFARECAARIPAGTPPRVLERGIEIRDVSFGYPGGGRAVLSDVSLSFPAGSTIALVGDNGAGKSTLVKLLTQLYSPSSGRILIDGQDLAGIDPGSWRERLSVGFQDFTKFCFEAGLAVGVGDLPRSADPVAIETALRRGDATAVMERIPHGLRTQLGSQFSGGVELSGGQWQRLALARGLMRTAPLLLLLDEPTAALDPEAEHQLLQSIAAATQDARRATGGIILLVSHRFSTVRMADLIVVLQDGRVREVGTHDELIARDGHYAELFRLQAKAYR